VRTGCTIGGIESVTLAFGAGLHFPAFAFDVATGNVLALFNDGFSSASFSFGWRVNL
jgi:hypothetical protein